MDNLVHLAHNVTVGEYSFLVAQVGVAGSTKLGKGVALGGQAGLVGHIEVGDGAQVGAQSGVHHSVPAGQAVMGSPALPRQLIFRIMNLLPKLPEIYQRLKELEKQVTELAAKPAEEHQE
jgi:UDP-3-O-[3-hydroxymyristoyl] glucosamine N-acyltransferase